MKLIDAEALKEEVKTMFCPDGYKIMMLERIDNAPTVEPEKALIANVTFDEDKLKEIVQTEVIDKIKSGELVIKDERPQGKWYEYICKGLLKSRHGDYVLYKIDYLLDNLAREIYLLEGARRVKGGSE